MAAITPEQIAAIGQAVGVAIAQAFQAQVVPVLKEALRGDSDRHTKMVDTKSFQRAVAYTKGTAAWRKFAKKTRSMAEQAYPGFGGRMLKAMEDAKNPIEVYPHPNNGIYVYSIKGKPDTEQCIMPGRSLGLSTNPQQWSAEDIGRQVKYYETFAADFDAVLVHLLDGEAETVHSNVTDSLAAWNRLRLTFDPKTKSHELVEYQRIMKPERAKSMATLLETIEAWEELWHKLPEGKLPDFDLLSGVLVGICPAGLEAHLQDKDISGYNEIKQEIIRKVNLHQVLHNKKGSNDMDVDALIASGTIDVNTIVANYLKGKGKGKSNEGPKGGLGKGGKGGNQFQQHWGWSDKGAKAKGKGKGGGQDGPDGGALGKNGKGKGKGAGGGVGPAVPTAPGIFQGYCSACWGWGHTAKYCPYGYGGGGKGLHQCEEERPPCTLPEQAEDDWGDWGGSDAGGLEHKGDEEPEREEINMGVLEPISSNLNNFPHLYGGTPQYVDGVHRPVFKRVAPRRWKPLDEVNGAKHFQQSDDPHPNCMCVSCDNLEVCSQNVAMNSVNKAGAPCKAPDRKIHLRAKADSGCGEHVLPPEQLPGIPIVKSPEEQTTYRTASGRVLLNGGQQSIKGLTSAGDRIAGRWQVAPGIKQPLLSLGKVTAHGHRVVLDDELPGGGYILHKSSGRRIPLEKRGNTYELDLYVDPPAPAPHFQRPAK